MNKKVYVTTDGEKHELFKLALWHQLTLSCPLSDRVKRAIAHYNHGISVNVTWLCFCLEIKTEAI